MSLYFPGTQAEQLSFVPVHPALQTHPATDKLSAGEDEFAGHCAHLPESTTYVPGMQIHLPDTGTVETEPVWHSVHVKPSARKPLLQMRHTAVTTSGIAARDGHLPGAGTHEHTQVSQFPSDRQ